MGITPFNNIDVIDGDYFKQNLCPNVRYEIIQPEEEIENLKLPARENRYGVWAYSKKQQLYGKISRALRFRNITNAVEKKYGIPNNLILAMIMLETGGIESLPNGTDDGGLGLCHMQPKLAQMFGLRTLDNCNALTSKWHGKKLRKLISEYNHQIRELINFDERFHPILNIDAVGRMLMYYKFPKGKSEKSWKMAVSSYGGIDKYPLYYNLIEKYRKALNNIEVLKEVRSEFNLLNKNMKIGGKKSDFDDYITYYWKLNYNYGLDAYNKKVRPVKLN